MKYRITAQSLYNKYRQKMYLETGINRIITQLGAAGVFHYKNNYKIIMKIMHTYLMCQYVVMYTHK